MSWFDDAVDAEARCGDKDMMIASFGLVVRIGTGYCDQYLLLALIRSGIMLWPLRMMALLVGQQEYKQMSVNCL